MNYFTDKCIVILEFFDRGFCQTVLIENKAQKKIYLKYIFIVFCSEAHFHCVFNGHKGLKTQNKNQTDVDSQRNQLPTAIYKRWLFPFFSEVAIYFHSLICKWLEKILN